MEPSRWLIYNSQGMLSLSIPPELVTFDAVKIPSPELTPPAEPEAGPAAGP